MLVCYSSLKILVAKCVQIMKHYSFLLCFVTSNHVSADVLRCLFSDSLKYLCFRVISYQVWHTYNSTLKLSFYVVNASTVIELDKTWQEAFKYWRLRSYEFNNFPLSWFSEYVCLFGIFFLGGGALLIKPSFPLVHRLCRAAVSTLPAFCVFLPVRHISSLLRSNRSVYVWCSGSCRCVISRSLFTARTLNPTWIPLFNQCLRLLHQTFPRWHLRHFLLQKRKVFGGVSWNKSQNK